MHQLKVEAGAAFQYYDATAGYVKASDAASNLYGWTDAACADVFGDPSIICESTGGGCCCVMYVHVMLSALACMQGWMKGCTE